MSSSNRIYIHIYLQRDGYIRVPTGLKRATEAVDSIYTCIVSARGYILRGHKLLDRRAGIR